MILHDPVAAKELRGISRRWQTYLGRCVFVAVTAYLLQANGFPAGAALPAEDAALRAIGFGE